MSDRISRQVGECATIDLDSDLGHEVQRDVERYIFETVDRETQLSNRTREKLRKVFQQRSGQTFLWKGYVWGEVKGRTWQEMQKIVRSVPPGLESIYTRTLAQIETR